MTELVGRAVVRGSGVALVLLACIAALAPSAFALPPANDNFALSELVSGASVTASGTNAEATKETGEPNHAGYPGGNSVWYRWTAPDTGTAVVDTQGSSFDTLLAVYTGASVGGLSLIASNDQWYGNQSRVKIPVTAGREYRIAVDGYYESQGSITLNIVSGPVPANDNLADAAVLSGSSSTASGSNVGATREPGEPSHSYYGSASVWWTWTAPSTGGVAISTAGSSFDTALAVYTGSSVSGLIPVASNDNAGVDVQSRVTFRAIEGTTYKIAVDGGGYYSSSEGAIALELNLSPPPTNDAFAAATALAGDAAVTATGSNLGASVEPGEPSHYSWETTSATVWYAWTAPSDGSLTLRADAAFSAVLAVYTGTQVAELTRVMNQAQPNWPGPEQIRVRVDAGVTYRIALDGRYGGSGTFNLTLNLIARPDNDDFDDADTLVGLNDTASGTNVGATQEPGEPIHEENYYDPSVWYQWTAPSDGGVTIDTAGSTFDTVVAVYTGDTVSTLTRVATTPTGNDGPERRNFRAAAGVTYRIAIDGRGAQQGTFQLELTEIVPPVNDMFADRLPVVAGDGTVEGDYIGATGENGEPGSGGTAGATVWYRYTAVETGRARLAITANDAPIEIGVHTGPTVDALTTVTSSTWSSVVSWRASAGTTYNIQIGGGARPWRGTFAFTLTQVAPPANDDFADAAALEGTSDSGSSDNTAATREPGEPSHYGFGDRSIWWEWTAPDNGRATIDVVGSFDWVAAVYTGSSIGSLTPLRSVDWGPLTFPAEAGTTYRIVVDSYSDYDSSYSSGAVSVALSLVDAPPNDDFSDATVLSGSSDAVTGSNVNATVDSSWEPAHAGSAAEHSVWYRWRAPATGQVTIDTAGSSFDSRMGVYTGSYNDYAYLTTIASNDDAGGTPQAAVSFMAQAGEVYRIAVDGRAGATGSIALALEQGTPPANDAFASAQQVSGSAVDVSGSSVFATSEAGEPDHAGNEGGASVWYRWTAPEDGTLTVSTAGSSFDTLLGVYAGSAVGGLTTVAANDNAPGSTASALETPVTAGTTYSIAVDGRNDRSGAAQGSVRLVLQLGPPATPSGAAASEDEPADPPVDEQTDPPVDEQADPPAGASDTSTTRAPSTTTASTAPNTQPAPTPAPAPPGPTPQTAAPAPLTVSATIPSQRIATVRRSGLAGTAVCSVACSVEVAVTLPKAKARLRAARASERAGATGAAGAATPFKVKLNAATRQALRRAKSLTLTVTVTARSGAATATATRRVTLRR